MSQPFRHLIADFSGVPSSQLRDQGMLSGLLIAAAGAAGFTAIGTPIVRVVEPQGSIAGVLLLDNCHLSFHAFPDRELLLLDVLSLATQDGKKAIDVFTRRLTARAVKSEQRGRG